MSIMTKSNNSDELRRRPRETCLRRVRPLIAGLGWVAACCWAGGASVQAAQVIHGTPGEAEVHSVINFRALAEMEKSMNLTRPYKTSNAPMPRGGMGTNTPAGGGGGIVAPVQSPAAAPGAFQAAAVP